MVATPPIMGSMRIQDVAKAYLVDGWAVVPLVQGAKKAATKWRTITYSETDFQDDSNIAVKLGEPSGWLVDVDCDTPLAMAVAKLLLPNTGRVFGRTGKPESHYLFVSKDVKTTQFTDGSKMIVELRSTGGYTMFPPSLHPSGEKVEWNIERDAMTIDADTLYAVVREVALTAIIAEHWAELDHASMGHLTGFWLQAKLDGITVKRLLKTICAVCDRTTTDEVIKMAEATIAKFAAGERVTGGPKLKEVLGEKLVNRMRSWLRVADVDAIDEMNERHFWVRMGKDDVVGREDDEYPVFQRPKALYTEYANRMVVTGMDEKGKPQLKPLFPAWLESPHRRSYRKVVFSPPPVPTEPEDYNLWRGYAVAPLPGRWFKFREHLLQIICSGNIAHFDYLLKLLAYTIQFPGERSQIAMVMRGEIGAGKGTLVRMLEEIFGHHFIQLDKVDQLVGRFNGAISGKVIVFADEAFWAGDKREVGALKRLITEPTLAIEYKNIDIVSQRNCVHLFMATNEEWSVPAGLRERRFFAVEVSSAKMQNHTYFNDIYDEMRQGGVAAFLHDMLYLPVTADEIRNVPMTTELRAQQSLSLPLEMRWWQECLSDAQIGQVVWTEWIACSVMYDAYKVWVREHTNRFLDKTAFGHRMGKFLSAEKTRARRLNGDVERCWRVRDLREARATFDKSLGTTTEWPDAGLPTSQGNVPF